jgi:hypothetical protein
MTTIELTADSFINRLIHLQSQEARKKPRSLKPGEADQLVSVGMGQIFALAKEHIEMPPAEIEKLLQSPVHRVRVGALSIMNQQARRKKLPESRRKELYDLYMTHHNDHIDTWDLVDLAAPYVVGGYLFDKPRDVLYDLARSENTWHRRTAMVSTGYFIRQGDVDDTFKIAEILVNDGHDLIHKAVGWMLRAAGGPKLIDFLDRHAATMPRVMLRYAIEHLDPDQRTHYLGLKKTR